MKTPLLHKITGWFLRFIQVQLFITSVSLPILISWGLPISILSPLGNLLFLPILVLFLFLSSVIFFLEICCLPNGIPIFFLEKLTSWWLSLMSLGKNSWSLVGLGSPPTLFLILVPLSAFFIIQHKKTCSIIRSILLLATLIICSVSYLKFVNRPHNVFYELECNGGNVTIAHTNGTTIVCDPGFIGKKISAPSWIEYTLVPEIIKKTGGNSIDHLIILQPSIMTFRAVEKLCSLMNIGTLYLPVWQGKLNKNGWRSFFFMKRETEKQKTKIIRIVKKEKFVSLSSNGKIIIKPLDQLISYQNALYPALCVIGQIDNKKFTLYSAKSKRTSKKKQKPAQLCNKRKHNV